MKTGWIEVIESSGYSSWYYTKDDGTPTENWLKIGGIWYYFTPGNGAMVSNTTRLIDGKVYAFETSGALVSKEGWVKFVFEGGRSSGHTLKSMVLFC